MTAKKPSRLVPLILLSAFVSWMLGKKAQEAK